MYHSSADSCVSRNACSVAIFDALLHGYYLTEDNYTGLWLFLLNHLSVCWCGVKTKVETHVEW